MDLGGVARPVFEAVVGKESLAFFQDDEVRRSSCAIIEVQGYQDTRPGLKVPGRTCVIQSACLDAF